MTLAAEAPDLDMVWRLRGPVDEFQHHRGLTHTFLGAPLVALAVVLFCWGVHRLRRRPPPTEPHWLRLWIYAWLAVMSHLLLDYGTSYALRPFAPFQWHWYSWDVMFLFEPVMFALLVGGLLVPGILGLVDREMSKRRPVFRGRGWAVAALLGVAVLYTVRGAEHARAMHLVEQTAFDRPVLRVAAEPFPLNPFHWKGIVETDNAYQFTDVNTRTDAVDPDANATVYKPAVTPAVAAAKQSRLGRIYLDWSRFPLVEDAGVGTPPDLTDDRAEHLERINFEDMRFGYSDFFGRPMDHRPLAGIVFLAPNGQVEATYMSGRPQE